MKVKIQEKKFQVKMITIFSNSNIAISLYFLFIDPILKFSTIVESLKLRELTCQKMTIIGIPI